ncbi:hypothetical protein OSTOST_01619 [Ostertagia ostertagi]
MAVVAVINSQQISPRSRYRRCGLPINYRSSILKISFAPSKTANSHSTIYGMIKEGKYNEVIRILQYEVQRTPLNRAALSLLGYCYYFTQVSDVFSS